MPSHRRISRKRARKRRVGSFYHPTKTTVRTGACGRSQILRKAYTRRDGTRVKAVCVKNKGLPGRTIASAKVLPKLKVGKLTRYGYYTDLSAKARLASLSKSVRGVGYATTIRRVVAIRNYSEHNPKLLKIYETDIKNLQKKYRNKRMKFRVNSKRRRPQKSSRRRRKKSSRRRSKKSSRRRSKKSSRRRRKKSSRRRRKKSSKHNFKFMGFAGWLLGRPSRSRLSRRYKKARKRQIREFQKSSEKIMRGIRKSSPRWRRARMSRIGGGPKHGPTHIQASRARLSPPTRKKGDFRGRFKSPTTARLSSPTRKKGDFRKSFKAPPNPAAWHRNIRSSPSSTRRQKQSYPKSSKQGASSPKLGACRKSWRNGEMDSYNYKKCVRGETYDRYTTRSSSI